MNEACAQVGYANNSALKCVDERQPLTVGQNIGRRIEQLVAEIKRLEDVRDQLATGSILDVDIHNLSMAMRNY